MEEDGSRRGPVARGGDRDKSSLLDKMMNTLAMARAQKELAELAEAAPPPEPLPTPEPDGPWFFITWPKVDGVFELQAATCGKGYVIRDLDDHQTWFVDKAEFDELYKRNEKADRWDIK